MGGIHDLVEPPSERHRHLDDRSPGKVDERGRSARTCPISNEGGPREREDETESREWQAAMGPSSASPPSAADPLGPSTPSSAENEEREAERRSKKEREPPGPRVV